MLDEHIVELQQQIDITFHSVLLLHEGSLPIYFAAADSQPDFGRRVDGQRRIRNRASGKIAFPIGDAQAIVAAGLERGRRGDVELNGGLIFSFALLHDLSNLFLFPVRAKPMP